MIFHTLDDKERCVGVYADGKLYFEDFPPDLTHTWKYSGSLKGREVEFAWLYTNGTPMEELCPDNLKKELTKARRKMLAYKKSFDVAKIDFRDHCVFELIPHDFLMHFCEIKNQIAKSVFDTISKPQNYDQLDAYQKLLHKIKYQTLRVDNAECKNLFLGTTLRREAQKILKGPQHIDYNLFGTVTGRLASYPASFPILTMKKELRRLIKPHNDWFLSLDYNGAEARTLLALNGEEQPQEDIHRWNIANVFKGEKIDRDEAKTLFFGWLYNPDSEVIDTEHYNRQKALDKYYKGGYINTIFGRQIATTEWKALNYLIQSTTADLVLDRAVAIDKFLENKNSFISHIVHDEIVIDLADEDRALLKEIKNIFARNKLDTFMVNLHAGKNYFDLDVLNL